MNVATPAQPRPRPRRALAAALALYMSFETGLARAAPSPRDLAYEQGVQAEEAGDHAGAAAKFAEAYRLTPPNEAGPRLLFLRASVAARLRAHAGATDTALHLCEARALLRDYLGETAPTGAQDPLAEERASLARVDQQLASADCAPAPKPPAPAEPNPAPATAPTSEPAPKDIPKSEPAPATLDPRPARPRRALVVAGATGLAAGAAAFVVMGVGIGLARDATRDGRAECWSMAGGCTGGFDDLTQILERGRLGDQLVKAGATIGGLASLTGIVLLALAARPRASGRVTLAPRLAPGSAGLGLLGRF